VLGPRRKDVVIVIKCGMTWDPHEPRLGGSSMQDSSAATIETIVECSLKLLQTDYIDVYLVHWPDPAVPLAQTMRAMEALRQRGKVSYVGVSKYCWKDSYGVACTFQPLSPACMYHKWHKWTKLMASMPVMEAVVSILESEGVEVCFGIPGAAILPLYKALSKSSRIRHLTMRHEEVVGVVGDYSFQFLLGDLATATGRGPWSDEDESLTAVGKCARRHRFDPGGVKSIRIRAAATNGAETAWIFEVRCHG